jgi:hypothetical protein
MTKNRFLNTIRHPAFCGYAREKKVFAKLLPCYHSPLEMPLTKGFWDGGSKVVDETIEA